MAIYPYRCQECGKMEEVIQSISSYSVSPTVPSCHGPMLRVITNPMVMFDTAPWSAYQSPIDGTIIDSRAKRNEHMAKHGVVMHDEIAPDVERNRKRIQAEMQAGLKQEIITAAHRVEAGYVPERVPEDQLTSG